MDIVKETKNLDQEVKKSIDSILNAGCTLQQTRELFVKEIDFGRYKNRKLNYRINKAKQNT